MEIVWLVLVITFCALLLPLVFLLWWRVRRVERLLRSQQQDQEEQLSLLLHELIEEIEHRGDAVITHIERREEGLRMLLQQAKALQLKDREERSQMTPMPDTKARVPDASEAEATATGGAHVDSLAKLIPEVAADERSSDEPERTEAQQELHELLEQGLSTDVIARRLKVGVGEVEVARNLSQWRGAPGSSAVHLDDKSRK